MIQIREETQTKIDLPAEGEKSDVITITGKKENVEKAKEMIQKIQNELVNINILYTYRYKIFYMDIKYASIYEETYLFIHIKYLLC